MFVSAVVVDAAWSRAVARRRAEWDHLVGMLDELDELCAEHGLRHGAAPPRRHARRDARRCPLVLERFDVRWCLDTGHLLIGGYDPAEFADDAAGRVAHVHLKDVDAASPPRVRAGS